MYVGDPKKIVYKRFSLFNSAKKTVLSSKKTVLEEKEKHYRKQKQTNNGHTKNISKLNLGRAVEL